MTNFFTKKSSFFRFSCVRDPYVEPAVPITSDLPTGAGQRYKSSGERGGKSSAPSPYVKKAQSNLFFRAFYRKNKKNESSFCASFFRDIKDSYAVPTVPITPELPSRVPQGYVNSANRARESRAASACVTQNK